MANKKTTDKVTKSTEKQVYKVDPVPPTPEVANVDEAMPWEPEPVTARAEPVAAREEISLTKNVEPETKAKRGKRYWMEISENVAGFMNFDPKIVFLVTENAEQETNLSRMTFEITKDEYNKRTASDA